MLHAKQTNCTKQSHVLYHNSYYNTKQIRMLLTDITHCKSPACPSLFQCCHMDVVLVAFASIFRCSFSPPSSNCITLSQPALYLSIHCLDAFHTPFCARKPAHTDNAGIYCILPELCTAIYIHHLYQSDNAIPRIVRPLKMLQTILHVQYLHLAVQC